MAAMDIHEVFSHPEVEMMVKMQGTPWLYDYTPKTTSLCIIELYENQAPRIQEDMNHEAFERYCKNQNLCLRLDETNGPILRIIFADSIYVPPPVNFKVPTNKRVDNDKTVLLMHHYLKVPALFFRDQAPSATYLTIGNAMFTRRAATGKPNVIEINSMVIDPRKSLLNIERIVFTQQKAKNISELHRVARDVRFIKDTVGALLEIIDHVINAQKQHRELYGVHNHGLDNSVHDSLALLKSKANSTMREVSSLEGRASLKIDLEYSLENQQDSRTNLKIARLTTGIAAAAQKDSSSMITMAAVTMFFLPGTFVSALFSMVFFDAPGDTRPGNLVVSPQWWIFLAITIPLTILVFLVWIVWKRWRTKALNLDAIQKETEEEKALEPHS
ncbi:Notoamide biosynthesis cluster protein M' [Psilocybe cubensis]|uniref:Uncharacterized protein n=2 Tax=Psilocybe cubensis TaxID=181762 RepID=A0A8H7Y2P6_PSICU|nr:Notoamide biosynthesis cluster protein M' [Psilocybe cubensis]KAH9484090.1 Notoamide biosynthesis cluster protein M' [Psilocybe cubensis]